MAEVDLKRCPFCGGYAHLDDPSEMGDYGVSCENCGLFVMFGKDGVCQTREEAAEAWNRRSSAKVQKNKMKQLAELFGKKIGEEFDVYYRESTDRCKFTDAGLFMRAENGKFIIADSTLRHILTGAVDYEKRFAKGE